MAGMWLPGLPCATCCLAVLPWLCPKPHLVSAAHWDHPAGVPWGTRWMPLPSTDETTDVRQEPLVPHTTKKTNTPRTWWENARGWMGENKITKYEHWPPTTQRATQLPKYALTHLRHDGLQLCCRLVKCQSKVVPGLAALLIELAPARTGTSSSHSMCHWHGVKAWCCHWS